MSALIRVVGLVAATVSLVACAARTAAGPEQQHALRAPAVRNLIVVIGDGMGPQQVALSVLYGAHVRGEQLALERMLRGGEVGLVQPLPHGALVSDSACAATELASGVQSVPGAIGIDFQGKPARTLVELAEEQGKWTGVVSDTRITHATPAAFLARVSARASEEEIAAQIVQTPVEVLLSGGYQYFLPQSEQALSHPVRGLRSFSSRRSDERDLLSAAAARGMEVVLDASGLAAVAQPPVLGLFSPSNMPDAFSERANATLPQRTVPTLREMTAHALRLLEQSPDGFLLVVEAGQIDWAGHANDAGGLLHEMLRLDAVLEEILGWAEGRDDTLIVLTSDHETGSFGFSYHVENVPPPTVLPGWSEPYAPPVNFVSPTVLEGLAAQSSALTTIVDQFHALPPAQQTAKELQRLVNQHVPFPFSLHDAQRALEREANRYSRPGGKGHEVRMVPRIDDFDAFYPSHRTRMTALIARALAPHQGVVWGSGSHTSTPVPVVALGRSQERFDGLWTMHELGALLQRVLAREGR